MKKLQQLKNFPTKKEEKTDTAQSIAKLNQRSENVSSHNKIDEYSV
jgi:hypothetical protein